jgi:hypothetical protein
MGPKIRLYLFYLYQDMKHGEPASFFVLENIKDIEKPLPSFYHFSRKILQGIIFPDGAANFGHLVIS